MALRQQNNSERFMNIKERYEKACQSLSERCKDMHPLANIAGQDKDGNYLIPEYQEYLEAYGAKDSNNTISIEAKIDPAYACRKAPE